jgi:hypothetical protein
MPADNRCKRCHIEREGIMRVGLVRNVGLSITALAVLALGGCNDDPLSFDVKDTTGIFVNPSQMVIAAGRTVELESRAVNKSNEPTFDEVSAAVDPTCGPATIQIIDVAELEIQPDGMFAITGGSTLGLTCIVLTCHGTGHRAAERRRRESRRSVRSRGCGVHVERHRRARVHR